MTGIKVMRPQPCESIRQPCWRGRFSYSHKPFMGDGIDMYLYGIPIGGVYTRGFWVIHKSCG